MKKVTKHYFSSGGIYLGSKEFPRWFTWFNAKTITIAILSILIGIGVVLGISNQPHSHNYKVNVTNALPF